MSVNFPLDHSSKLSISEEMFHKELAVLSEQRDKLQEQLQNTKVFIIDVQYILTFLSGEAYTSIVFC